jgi:hypothetical protein
MTDTEAPTGKAEISAFLASSDIQSLAERIRDEIAWQGPGSRSWLGLQLTQLVADPIGVVAPDRRAGQL